MTARASMRSTATRRGLTCASLTSTGFSARISLTAAAMSRCSPTTQTGRPCARPIRSSARQAICGRFLSEPISRATLSWLMTAQRRHGASSGPSAAYPSFRERHGSRAPAACFTFSLRRTRAVWPTLAARSALTMQTRPRAPQARMQTCAGMPAIIIRSHSSRIWSGSISSPWANTRSMTPSSFSARAGITARQPQAFRTPFFRSVRSE